jgi:two-component system chemotaxis sensor kinase CheA
LFRTGRQANDSHRGRRFRGQQNVDSNQDIVRDFLVESYENLDQLDRDLVALEKEPDSRDKLGSIFRTIHTIKGTCGFLGFGKLESVTHVGENLLSLLRDGELQLRPDITTGLLSLVDAIREMLGNIESCGSEGDAEYAALVATLSTLQQFRFPAPEVPAAPVVEPTVLTAKPAEVATPPSLAEDRDAMHADVSSGGASSSEGRSGVSEGTIRVDVGLLDKLMNRVGELVLARNQILQFTGTLNDAAFLSTSQRLNLITTELQEGVMKTRMQPIGNLWSKFPRVVRDLALQCGKSVRIELQGKETELDKTIVEAIKDPLTHLVRNAVDHGIESPEVRLAAGKPAEGVLRLRAFHEGGQVNIEISDDGGGLNPERIRQKALERGLITPDQALRMNDRESAQLIFAPGFSTAAQITNVSGRGVGMDVVKTNVERIGGAVDIQSQPGVGTTVKLKIPLTLAIIPALIVTCGEDRYAIPQVSLLELVRLEGEQARQGIERLHGAPVYRLRGQLLPIVYLRKELELDASSASDATDAHDVLNIVILRADDRQFGLVVDSINDTEEIVVKPLSQQLKGVPVYAGSTIMGDGKVALILDVLGMAQRARVVSEVRDRTLSSRMTRSDEQASDRQTLLILEVGTRRLAIPISMVARLEEIPRESIEQADQQEVVQYRGQILPLLRLAELVGVTTEAGDGPLQVVVYHEQGRSLGLVVDRIADIVESNVEIKRRVQSDNFLASAVIQERVTELLNLPAVIRRLDGVNDRIEAERITV